MWVRSQPGAGATFSFTIHFDEHEARATSAAAPSVDFSFDPTLAARCPLRLLVAEDNPVNQKIALFLLRKFGYEADLASNGLEALKRLETSTYDMILLDIQMPGMDGLQTARAVRDKFSHPGRPWLVALTANARTDDRREAEQAGINDYLSKPVQGAELQRAIERAAEALAAGEKSHGAVWELPEGLRELLDADTDTDVVREILALFLADSAPLVNDIRAAHAAQHGEALRRLLHRFKGSASQVGALRLTGLCRSAEAALSEAGPASLSLQSCLLGIDAEWQRAAEAIRQWLNGRAAGA